jgi:hypothetical protein
MLVPGGRHWEAGRQQPRGLSRCRTDPLESGYLIPITSESGPTSGSMPVDENPASFIQP